VVFIHHYTPEHLKDKAVLTDTPYLVTPFWERTRCIVNRPMEKSETFSPWPLSLVDRADSLLLNVGE